MLEKQPWIAFAPDMLVEWQQCVEEGLDVADCQEACREMAEQPAAQSEADALAKTMHARPRRGDYAFLEPSDLPGIHAARPAARPALEEPTKDLSDRIRGAWIGRVAGCLLGKPVESFRRDRLYPLLKESENYPLHKYIRWADIHEDLAERLRLDPAAGWADMLDGLAPVDDDINYTTLALRLVETYGRNFRANDVLEAWLQWLPMLSTCTAERVAYRNAAMGLTAPATARHHNPYREWIGAQIRGDFFGYICPGRPQEAAAMAFRDASISHVKNGIYGEMFVAAMLAAAAVCTDRERILDTGLGEIPENCRLRTGVDKVRDWYQAGLPAEEIVDRIHGLYDERKAHDWCHVVPNAMIVTMALLCGGGDFGKSICLAVQAAFDTDCNGATVGSILGMLKGAEHIDRIWIEPFHCGIRTAIDGMPLVTLDELTTRTLALIG